LSSVAVIRSECGSLSAALTSSLLIFIQSSYYSWCGMWVGRCNACSYLYYRWCCSYQITVSHCPHSVILRLSAVPVILQCH
jgi:hypothetical protein